MADVRPVILKYGDKEYTLEFDRDSVLYAEDIGFDRDNFKTKLMESTTLFFHLAFRMHHPELTQEETDHILFEDLGGLSEAMTARLIELYNKPYSTLENRTGKPKNAKLTVVM